MDNFHSADIIYFSGTGGTAKAAFALEKELIKKGITVNTYELNGKSKTESSGDLLIILFPVYAANAPKSIDEWVKAAPFGNSKKTAVISVSGGGEMIVNTACRVSTIKGLAKKGYDVFYEEMFVMPTNCFASNSDELNAMLLNVLPQKAHIAVQQIITENIHRKKPLVIDRVITKAMLIEKHAAKLFGKNLAANDDCNGCGLCAENCPRNNIIMQNQKPVFNGNCVICLKCVYACPQKAIIPKYVKSFIIKEGFDIKAIEEKAKYITKYPPAKEAAKGFLYKGARKYLEEEGY